MPHSDGRDDMAGRLRITQKRGVHLVCALSLLVATAAVARTHETPSASASPSAGLWLVASDGGIFTFGDAAFHGSTGDIRLNQPIVGMASTPTGNGYWLVASDGGIFTFGDAAFHGSTGDIRLNQPIVGMASTPTGNGYWLVASDGGIFTFGDAAFHGSTGDIRLNQPIVGMASTPTGNGYWLVASDGGIFAFGDAAFHGSAAGTPQGSQVVDVEATATGRGYWLALTGGPVLAYGDARQYGYPSSGTGAVAGIARTADGLGYWTASRAGVVYAFGSAKHVGHQPERLFLTKPVVGMSVRPTLTMPTPPTTAISNTTTITSTSTMPSTTSTSTTTTTSTTTSSSTTTTVANAPSITQWVTTGDGMRRLASSAVTAGGPSGSAGWTLAVGTTEMQQMVGVGAALTESAAFLFATRLDADERREALRSLFDRDTGAGLDLVRLVAGSSDFSLTHRSYDDSATPDPTLSRFSIGRDFDYVIPIAREILAINPDVRFVASMWSPPAWMKTSGSLQLRRAQAGVPQRVCGLLGPLPHRL